MSVDEGGLGAWVIWQVYDRGQSPLVVVEPGDGGWRQRRGNASGILQCAWAYIYFSDIRTPTVAFTCMPAVTFAYTHTHIHHTHSLTHSLTRPHPQSFALGSLHPLDRDPGAHIERARAGVRHPFCRQSLVSDKIWLAKMSAVWRLPSESALWTFSF